MTRRYASRDNPPATQPAAGPRDFGQTAPVRPPSTTLRCTWCGGHFVDDEPGRHAHWVVFSHQPRTEKDSDEEGE